MRPVLLTLLLPACASSPPGPPAPLAPDAVTEPCGVLVQAPPAEWATVLPPVLALGAAGAAPLIAALQRHPSAPGAQAAVAALGRTGNPAAVPFLLAVVADRGEQAVEAALALGELAPLEHAAALQSVVDDRLADATLRTACACTLLRLGIRRPVAPLIRGVLLAGTPAGQDLQVRLGLPERPRWAHERYLIQRTLRHTAGTDFGLDTDASWPDLLASADRIAVWLQESH